MDHDFVVGDCRIHRIGSASLGDIARRRNRSSVVVVSHGGFLFANSRGQSLLLINYVMSELDLSLAVVV